MSFEVTVSQKDQTLPMIVMMRGDERIVDDFTYDADQAMEYLGIKRSRLTQISGRELRVGRIRRDRYIRPVYRECDLRDYLDWTRATATHLSSSKAIEQAIESLDDRFNDVLVVLQERLSQQSSEEQAWLSTEIKRLRRSLIEVLKKDEAAEGFADWSPLLKRFQAEQTQMKGSVEEIFALVRETGGRVDFFLQEIRELRAAQSRLRLDLENQFEKVGQFLSESRAAEAQKADVESQQRLDLSQAIDQLSAFLRQQEKEAEITVVKPARAPRLQSRGRLRSYWR